jgi:hypothetical protein
MELKIGLIRVKEISEIERSGTIISMRIRMDNAIIMNKVKGEFRRNSSNKTRPN